MALELKGYNMSNELAVIGEDLGMSLAEAMGVSTGGETRSASIPRITQIHSGVMGTMEVNGKTIKTEVIPAGAYKLSVNQDTVVYSNEPTIRIFAVRQQWQKWDSDNDTMVKSVMSNDLKGDLKDSQGTFNVGRPSGYIEDFKALPKDKQDLIRSIKRTMIVFGTAKFNNAMDANGDPIEGYDEEIPFVMDIKNALSIKALNGLLKTLQRKNVLPIQYSVALGGEMHELPTGASYASMVFKPDAKAGLLDTDNDTLRSFVEYINWSNSYILDQWAEKNSDGLSAEDADVVHQFVNVEEAD
jgi:hypothetical protein